MRRRLLTLPLFVTRVLAEDANDVLALHDLAVFTESFDGFSYFHRFFSPGRAGFRWSVQKFKLGWRRKMGTKKRSGKTLFFPERASVLATSV
jgi:hypothetical protein